MRKESRRSLLILFVLVVASALSLPWLSRPFHTRGEPREALVAQAMLAKGDWISPPAYHGAVPSKPPFSHWLISVSSLPFGAVSEATARFPSAVAFIVFAVAFFVFLAKRTSDDVAFATTLVLLSCSEFFRAASTCRVDTLLATSMAGALLALFSWWERGCRGYPWLAFILTCCSALTKGPIGIVLPIGIFSFFSWSREGFRARFLPREIGRALAISIPAAAVVSVWYVCGYVRRGNPFLEKIWYENFERFASTMADEPHKHSAWYLIGMLLVGLLPWTIVIILPLFSRAMGRRVLDCMKNVSRVSLASRWSTLPALYQFSVIAACSIILFFCIPSSKRSVYLLPAYPFLALILEWMLRMLSQKSARIARGLSSIVGWGSALICLAAFVLMATPVGDLVGISLRFDALLAGLSWGKCLISFVVVGALVSPLRPVLRDVVGSAVSRLAFVTIAAVCVISFIVYDTVAVQLSPKRWLRSADFLERVDLAGQSVLYSHGTEMYGVSFESEKPFAPATRGLASGSLVFVERRKLEDARGLVGAPIDEIAALSSGVQDPKRDIIVGRVR